MNTVKTYAITVLGVSVIGLLLNCILPDGVLKKYSLYATSIVLTFCLVKPLCSVSDDFSVFIPENSLEYDYTDVVTATVHGISGFENADVYVESENNEITFVSIKCKNEKITEAAVSAALSDYVKKVLASLYKLEYGSISIEVI